MKKSVITCWLFALMLCCSCGKNFGDINIDPTKLSPQNMEFNYLLTTAQLYAAGNADGYSAGIWESSLSYSATMMQQLSSTSSYWLGDKYFYNQLYNAAYWTWQYQTSIKTITDLINNIKEDPARQNLYQVSRILKAYLFQRITDLYGDVPYFNAGQGYAQGITNPAYDLQQDIYADMLHELEDAAALLDDTAPVNFEDADVYYGGDITKWKKFAYSEMLRIAMRMSKVDVSMAQTWAKKAADGGVMQSNDDNAICIHDAKGTSPVSNPVGLQLASREPGSYRLSETLVRYLKDNDDPRLPYVATIATDPTDGGDLGDNDPAVQLGQPNGYDRSSAATDISNASNWPGDQNLYSVVNRTTFAREDAPTFILTYAETQLLLAEAAQRSWISGSAADFYNNGVTGAILQLNQAGAILTEQEAQSYLDAHPYNAADGLVMINTQYWMATFADWNETWCNWRRSGYPELVPVNYQGNATNGTIPRRFTYPLDEANVNPQHYLEAIQRIIGGDAMTSRVWWDK